MNYLRLVACLFILATIAVIYPNGWMARIEFHGPTTAFANPNELHSKSLITEKSLIPRTEQNPIAVASQGPATKRLHRPINQLNQNELYCFMKKNLDLPLTGNLHLMTGQRLIGDQAETYVLVASSDCPRDSYSIIFFDQETSIKRTLDCRETDLSELAVESAFQWTVNEAPARSHEVHLAISGPGFFLKYCLPDGFQITRNGRFRIDSEGTLLSEEGCLIWSHPTKTNPQGGPITGLIENKITAKGCFSTSRCVLTTDAHSAGIKSLQYADSKNFHVDMDLTKLSVTQDLKLFTDSLEDLDNPERSPTGTPLIESWQRLVETTNCETHDRFYE
jgi:hypothetical protein